MNPQVDNQDTAQSSAYNAFPEPQTIPAGWDTSVFMVASPDTSAKVPDDLDERESE